MWRVWFRYSFAVTCGLGFILYMLISGLSEHFAFLVLLINQKSSGSNYKTLQKLNKVLHILSVNSLVPFLLLFLSYWCSKCSHDITSRLFCTERVKHLSQKSWLAFELESYSVTLWILSLAASGTKFHSQPQYILNT